MKFINHYSKITPKAISLTTEVASFWYSGPSTLLSQQQT
jgi:hypothetical protein